MLVIGMAACSVESCQVLLRKLMINYTVYRVCAIDINRYYIGSDEIFITSMLVFEPGAVCDP